jgi:hypothetical protein
VKKRSTGWGALLFAQDFGFLLSCNLKAATRRHPTLRIAQQSCLPLLGSVEKAGAYYLLSIEALNVRAGLELDTVEVVTCRNNLRERRVTRPAKAGRKTHRNLFRGSVFFNSPTRRSKAKSQSRLERDYSDLALKTNSHATNSNAEGILFT